MKTYHGRRTEYGCAVDVEENGEVYSLHPRHDLRNHSPTGFEWSYSGSGPAQLALALAADVLGDDDYAQEIYQRLKFLCGTLHKNFYADLRIMRRKLTVPVCSRGNSLAEAA